MGFKKLILGEDMPDKNDPKYKKRYEQDVEAGRKFAKTMKLDKGVAWIQNYASTNTNSFLVIVFIFVFVCVGLNIYRMTRAYSIFNHRETAVEQQEKKLQEQITRQTEPIKDSSQFNMQEYISYKK